MSEIKDDSKLFNKGMIPPVNALKPDPLLEKAKELYPKSLEVDCYLMEKQQQAYIKGHLAGAANSAGVWVKASTRLPKGLQPVFIKVDSDGAMYVSYWQTKNNAFMVDGKRYPPTLYYIEWLDESGSSLNSEVEALRKGHEKYLEAAGRILELEEAMREIANQHISEYSISEIQNLQSIAQQSLNLKQGREE